MNVAVAGLHRHHTHGMTPALESRLQLCKKALEEVNLVKSQLNELTPEQRK